MIALTDVNVQFGGVHALDAVTLEIGPGVTGLIGPNGAGKTTLLNVLSGFVRPRSGTVRTADGEDFLTLAPHRRARWGLRRGFQHDRIVDGLSVREHVLVAAEHTGGHGAGAAADEALALVGLDDVAGRQATELDQRRRRLLEIGRAVVGAPRVILLDEPAAGLDERETADLADLIGRLPELRDAAVVLVDHDMALVRRTCARLAVLDFGRLLATGETEAVLADRAVQDAYLGATPTLDPEMTR
ncbi:Methionine import ATP-binding protein MetN [Baekduia alba]|uniref:ABC transporter ATP-binding protein n=1 Tax=Baekduia alba TaxID=2997333 RepID=UPI0023415E1A|nr:ATP-binding cassette domain-containing protein [Baekduia alba]WCB95272.1 Methionine import ATP-binding protein MetN [Baekduia alba]